MSRWHPIALALVLGFMAEVQAANIQVINTNDSGPGSLRQAILDSNASVGVVDTIAFNIPGSGVQTIAPASLLPTISDPVVIDGYSQPGSSPNTLAVGDDAVILIELAGTGGISTGLNISAGNTTVHGLALTRITAGASGAIAMTTNGSNVVEGCFIGVNPSGTVASANGVGFEILATAPNNRIGGTSPAQRNIISGQTGFAMSVNSNNNIIAGNYIGTDRTGKVKIPNAAAIGGSGSGNTIGGTAPGAGNVISGNGTAGNSIAINIFPPGWIIQGNLIGVDATGTLPLGNSGTAISLTNGGNHLIGGTTVAARNVISANNIGIAINAADGITIQGNYIGTDITGTVGLGNIRNGIGLGNSAQNTIIGGLTDIPGQPPGNVISATQGTGIADVGAGITTNFGNGSPANSSAGTLIRGNLIGTDQSGLRALGNKIGVFLGEPNVVLGGTSPRARNVISGNTGTNSGNTSTGAVIIANKHDVIGNFIGTDITGSHPLGNAAHGILIPSGVGNINPTIQGNTIGYNAGSGIRIASGTANYITANSINYNQLIGIDLGAAGPTPNDSGDADTGANNLQNFPVLTSVTSDGTNTSIAGTLNSIANTTFSIEFFATSVRDASGYGQGENYIGTSIVTTDGTGNASFNVTFPTATDGQWFTATAIDPAGNTSEFSQAIATSSVAVLNATVITARTGQPFRCRVLTANGSPTQQVNASGLPPGLTIDSVTGVISGTPTADGTYDVQLTVSGGAVPTSASFQIACVSDPGLPVIVSASIAVVPHGQTFSYKIDAPAQTTPSDVTTYSIYGPLPSGLSFDATNGVISGTVATIKAIHTGESMSRALSGGTLLTVIQLFASNSHGQTTSPLTLLQLPPMALNISTRLAVGTSENVLIGGFIVTGNAPKIAIFRGLGPSLGAGLQGVLQDTILELRDSGGGLVATNDDWRANQEAEIKETTIPPGDEREAAIVALLSPGSYTAVLKGKSDSTGIGLVEGYDLGTASSDIGAAAQFANLSTRGFVRTENDVMIGGLIAANGAGKFLLRAIGPSLTSQGVQGALSDPVLELHSGDGALVASNDNWKNRSDGSSQEAEIVATTVPPKNDLESALVQTVAPGNYTAVVRGKNNTTGVGLVEIFNLQ